MDLNVKKHGDNIAVVSLSKQIDTTTTPVLRERLRWLLMDHVNRFVVDLSDVTFLDSTGMGALVSLLKHARESGGEVKLVWPKSEAAQNLLNVVRFDRVFERAASVDDALKSYGAS